MANLKELRDDRLRKLAELKQAGLQSHPQLGERTEPNATLVAEFEQRKDSNVKAVGRITSIRLMGGMCFIDLTDESGKIQVVANKKILVGDKTRNQLDFAQLRLLDAGDFIQSEGKLDITQKGEISIFATAISLLSKSLRPLPDRHEGFKDIQKRYRQRYVDLQLNPEVKRHIELRSQTTEIIRQFLIRSGFIEIETPVLQPLYGGASARPFTTYHHKLESDLFLRISNELYLKRAIVAGFERVFEFSRDFRNEGIDRSHNPEFTMLEFYWAYADYNDLMVLTEQMISEVLMATHGQLKFTYQGHELDFTPPYKRVTFQALILEKTGIDIDTVTREDLISEIKHRKIEIDLSKNPPMKDLIDEFYKETCRQAIIQPIFLIDWPVAMKPLAKKLADNPNYTATMQLVCAGAELINSYNEINDPVDQLERMQAEQQALDEGATEEAQPLDYDYIRALEIGMPPTAGWGLGIDRFVSILCDQPAIKDVIMFPTLRPEVLDGAEFEIDNKYKNNTDA
jgi:lysyl-tRNA synthetase class 2